MRRPGLLALALLLAAPPLCAQSLFSATGLGLPIDAVGARARALGNVGIGLLGGGLLPSDPAAAAGLIGAAGLLSAQPSWVDFSRADGSESGSFQGQRFPLGGFAYPGPRGVVATLTFSSQLDQRYRAARESPVAVSGGTGAATDTLTQEGGVSLVAVGLARRFGPRLAAGLTIGRYTGSVTRTLVRRLGGDVDVIGDPVAFFQGGRWRYSGMQLTGGASLQVGTVARIAGSATWSGDLHADADEGTTEPSRTYDLPVTLRVGASALLAEGLMLSAAVARAGWSDVGLTGGVTASPTLTYGAGLELGRARLLGRSAPLRLGYRRGTLPFASVAGVDAPTESVLAGGIGLSLDAAGTFALGGIDVSVERGERSSAELTERFWRANVTIRVAGF